MGAMGDETPSPTQAEERLEWGTVGILWVRTRTAGPSTAVAAGISGRDDNSMSGMTVLFFYSS